MTGTMRAWRVHEYGSPAAVLQLDEVDVPAPGPNEVLIRVAAITLNFNDLDGIHGRYKTVRTPMPYIPGMEVMGVVDACGDGAQEWLGQRVVAIPSLAFGGYAEYVTAPTAMTFTLPESIPLPQAAGILMPFHLGWLALYERGGLQDGETLLVHAGAGGAGSAAIQLGVHAGARVIATAGSAQKLAFCRDLGADVVINYREEDFVTAVLDATDGRGVDVAFDAIGGTTTTETFKCMAFNGRHLIVGFASGIEAEDEGIVPRPVVFGNFSLVGVCHAYVDDPIAFKALTGFNFPAHQDGVEMHTELCELIDTGVLRPIVGQEVDFAELPAGLTAMENRQTMGRTVVLIDLG